MVLDSYSISIVTICYNNLDDLIRTCESVDRQTELPFEHWIIDGSVSTSIAEWLQNNPQPVYRKWKCERDHGIADAFNKGISFANGDIVHLLNAGDIYATQNVLMHVADAFAAHADWDWLSGKIILTRLGQKVTVGKPFDPQKLYRGMRSVSHPTWFVKKRVYGQVGKYSDAYSIAMDYEMMCRLKPFSAGFLNKPLVLFDDTGVSTRHYLEALRQTRKAFESHYGFSIKMHCWQLRLKILYFLQQTRLGKCLFEIKRRLGLENM